MACGTSTKAVNVSSTKGMDNGEIGLQSSTPKPFKVRVTSDKSDFYGCWSSGSGKVLRLTKDQVFLSTNSFKPVNYADEQLEDGRLLIRLIERPDFYFFSPIVTMEFEEGADVHKDFALHIWDYDNDDDLSNLTPTGRSAWVKFDCEQWFGRNANY